MSANTPHSSLLTPHSSEEPGVLAAVGALLLVGALVAAIFLSMKNPVTETRAQVRQARASLADGRYSEAAALYERLLLTTGDPDVRLGLSYAYLARHDTERAERQAREALTRAPLDLQPAAWAQLGRVLLSMGRTHEALDAWSSAIQSAARYPGNPPIQAEARSATWHTAMVEWARGDYLSARAHLETLQYGNDIYATSAQTKLAQLLAPTNSDISQQLLAALEAHGTATDSKYAIRNTQYTIPGLSEGLSPDVISNTITGLRRAFLDLDRARKSGADEAGIAALWGRAYLQVGDPYLAKTYLQRAVDLQPQLSDAHSYLALALLDTGDEAAALDHATQAATISPQRPLPHHILAQLYLGREDWVLASQELSALKKLEPDGLQTHMQLADYYTRRSAYDQAEEQYQAAVDAQRADGDQSGGLDASLALARFYTDLRGQGCEKGLPAAQESLKLHPGDPASLDAVGWALVQCAKPQEALQALESAVAATPSIARFRYHLAKAYARLTRPADARAQYIRAIDLDPGGPWERLAKADIVKLP